MRIQLFGNGQWSSINRYRPFISLKCDLVRHLVYSWTDTQMDRKTNGWQLTRQLGTTSGSTVLRDPRPVSERELTWRRSLFSGLLCLRWVWIQTFWSCLLPFCFLFVLLIHIVWPYCCLNRGVQYTPVVLLQNGTDLCLSIIFNSLVTVIIYQYFSCVFL